MPDFIVYNALSSILRESDSIPESVQEHFLNDDSYRDFMIRNKNLSESVVSSRLKTRSDTQTACLYAGRRLSHDQMRSLLKRERRVGVLNYALINNPPSTPDEVNEYGSLMPNPERLGVLYYAFATDPTMANALGPFLSPLKRLVWMAQVESAPLTLLGDTLRDLPTTNSAARGEDLALVALFDLRPEAIDIALGSNRPNVRLAIAKSINLTDDYAARLLGLTDPDLDIPMIGGFRLDLRVDYYLVRNLVASPRLLGFIARHARSARSIRDLANRRLAAPHRLYPAGLKDLRVDSHDLAYLVEEMYNDNPANFARRVPRYFISPSRRSWVYPTLTGPAALDVLERVRLEIDADTVSQASEYELDRTTAETIGPVRIRKIVDHLRAIEPAIKVPEYIEAPNAPPIRVYTKLDPARRAQLLARPASQVTDSDASLHLGRLLTQAFGDDVSKWTLFAEFSTNRANTTIGEILGVIKRITK